MSLKLMLSTEFTDLLRTSQFTTGFSGTNGSTGPIGPTGPAGNLETIYNDIINTVFVPNNKINQGQNSVVIGYNAGNNNCGTGAICIGESAGNNTCGENSVCIGRNAGIICPSNTVVINGDGIELNPSNSGCYVNPINNITGLTGTTPYMVYTPLTKEINYVFQEWVTISNPTIYGTIIDPVLSGVVTHSLNYMVLGKMLFLKYNLIKTAGGTFGSGNYYLKLSDFGFTANTDVEPCLGYYSAIGTGTLNRAINVQIGSLVRYTNLYGPLGIYCLNTTVANIWSAGYFPTNLEIQIQFNCQLAIL